MLKAKGLFLAAVEVNLEHPCDAAAPQVHVTIPEPRRFVAFRAQNRRRWVKHRQPPAQGAVGLSALESDTDDELLKAVPPLAEELVDGSDGEAAEQVNEVE